MELSLEQRLVDLSLVDRHVFLEADPDHLVPVDPDLLRELVGRQVVGHFAPSTKKPAAHNALAGLDLQLVWAQGGELHVAAHPVAVELIVTQP